MSNFDLIFRVNSAKFQYSIKPFVIGTIMANKLYLYAMPK